MNRTRLLSWLLVGVVALTSCGSAGTHQAAASSSGTDASASTPPAQSAMQPLNTLPSASQPSDTAADTSQEESSAIPALANSPEPDSSSVPSAPPATVTKPSKDAPKSTETPEPGANPPDSSGEICKYPPASSSEEPAPKAAPTKADAAAFIGKSVSSLIAAIGAPKGTDYTPSCLGDGEDGELFYDGFTVYTYRLNGTETVQDVV